MIFNWFSNHYLARMQWTIRKKKTWKSNTDRSGIWHVKLLFQKKIRKTSITWRRYLYGQCLYWERILRLVHYWWKREWTHHTVCFWRLVDQWFIEFLMGKHSTYTIEEAIEDSVVINCFRKGGLMNALPVFWTLPKIAVRKRFIALQPSKLRF
jgi:hypothetical protein